MTDVTRVESGIHWYSSINGNIKSLETWCQEGIVQKPKLEFAVICLLEFRVKTIATLTFSRSPSGEILDL